MNGTFSTTQIQTLLAAGIDLNEFFADAVKTPPAKPAKKAAKPEFDLEAHNAAKKHNFEARMTRREESGARGLTKAEKSALYGALPVVKSTGKPSAAAWNRIVAEYKAAEKATGITVAEFVAAL